MLITGGNTGGVLGATLSGTHKIFLGECSKHCVVWLSVLTCGGQTILRMRFEWRTEGVEGLSQSKSENLRA